MSDRSRRPASGRQSARQSNRGDAGQPSAGGGQRAQGPANAGAGKAKTGAGPAKTPAPSSHSASGTPRAGRREFDRRRAPQPATPTLIDKLRRPLLAAVVVIVLAAAAFVVFSQAASPAYACDTVDTVQSPAPGDLGQVQADQGNQHVQTGDKVTYRVCPPASGRHISQPGSGPIAAKVYGPNDQAVPNGWVHNLEHGGLVLLYSCAKGAPCDSTATTSLQAFYDQFPVSAVCKLAPGPAPNAVSPVIARFDQMPTKFAALVWDRALYLDTLDTSKIDQFFLKYAERLSANGSLIAPPEPQCAAPSSSPAASSSSAPSSSASGGTVPQGTSPSPASSASGG